MFTEKQIKPSAGCRSDDGKFLPNNEHYVDLLTQLQVDIQQTDELVDHLAEEPATSFLIEFRDASKPTSAYL
jgi:hypothetical protein